MKKNIWSILIKLALVSIGVSGIIVTYVSAGFMSGGTTFLYFTIQSNITIIAITAIYLVDAIGVLRGREPYKNQILRHIKLSFTVAITITFIVFVTLLAPITGVAYFFSYSNFSLHIIVPILAILDYFLFDTDIKIFKLSFLVGTAMPVYYFFFYLIGRAAGFTYLNGDKAPYFFLDFEKYGWFSVSSEGIGVFYWVTILLVFAALLGLMYALLMKLRQKKISQ